MKRVTLCHQHPGIQQRCTRPLCRRDVSDTWLTPDRRPGYPKEKMWGELISHGKQRKGRVSPEGNSVGKTKERGAQAGLSGRRGTHGLL